MSLEGSSLGPPALPPPVVFLDNLSADIIHGEPPIGRRSPSLTNSKSLPPAAATQVKYAEQIDMVEAGLEPLEEDLGVEEDGGDDELNYEDEDEWEDMMAASNLGKQQGGGGLRERTDIRNFNYDVIVDFVNQGRFIFQGYRISNCYIGTVWYRYLTNWVSIYLTRFLLLRVPPSISVAQP
jgi:hypothetical protein